MRVLITPCQVFYNEAPGLDWDATPLAWPPQVILKDYLIYRRLCRFAKPDQRKGIDSVAAERPSRLA
ncbi:hypothetical protein N183_35435 [Sinorhizobium sp. Sb3]|nr:hypothetical protein N183_35435 [Sinorhizobium sp. Sb3]